MKIILFLILEIIPFLTIAQNHRSFNADTVVAYRDNPNNNLYFYYPSCISKQDNRTALILFFGGGWNGGTPKQFLPQAQYLTQYGIVVILADYQTKGNANTTPKEALMDAKSAIRFIRKNAERLGINPNKILAGGGSAGGHLAAGTAFCDQINHDDDDLSISSIPQALVLFNPVIDNGPGGYGYERVSNYYKDFSPLHNIKKGSPPSILFLGTKDKLIPIETGKKFKEKIERAGGRCDLKLYPNREHGFFNKNHEKDFRSTMKETICFLKSLGYID